MTGRQQARADLTTVNELVQLVLELFPLENRRHRS